MATVGVSGQTVQAGAGVQSLTWDQFIAAWRQFLANPIGQQQQVIQQQVPAIVGGAGTSAFGLKPDWLQGLEVYGFLLLLVALGLYGLLAPGR